MMSMFTRMLQSTRRARTAAVVAVTIAGTLGATVVLAPPASAAVSTLYVAQGGADTGDCSDAASPCATVSYALTQAASGATINVSGTINDNVVLGAGANVTITGVDAPAGSPAVIDGQGKTSVIYNSNGYDVTLSYLTLQHGYSDYGGGIYSNS
jgi:hypothetical protein